MGTATKVIGIVFGIIIILFGLMIFGGSMMMPVLFAGQYIMLALIVIIVGAVVIWLGVRSGRRR